MSHVRDRQEAGGGREQAEHEPPREPHDQVARQDSSASRMPAVQGPQDPEHAEADAAQPETRSGQRDLGHSRADAETDQEQGVEDGPEHGLQQDAELERPVQVEHQVEPVAVQQGGGEQGPHVPGEVGRLDEQSPVRALLQMQHGDDGGDHQQRERRPRVSRVRAPRRVEVEAHGSSSLASAPTPPRPSPRASLAVAPHPLNNPHGTMTAPSAPGAVRARSTRERCAAAPPRARQALSGRLPTPRRTLVRIPPVV